MAQSEIPSKVEESKVANESQFKRQVIEEAFSEFSSESESQGVEEDSKSDTQQQKSDNVKSKSKSYSSVSISSYG